MLETMLLDNPEIDEEVRRRCETHPKYQALKADCDAKWQALQDAFIAWEDACGAQRDFFTLAYYHMGLGVRQELFTAFQLGSAFIRADAQTAPTAVRNAVQTAGPK